MKDFDHTTPFIMSMLGLFVLCLMLVALYGCALQQAQQNPNITPQQLAMAECSDIQALVLGAQITLNLSGGNNRAQYILDVAGDTVARACSDVAAGKTVDLVALRNATLKAIADSTAAKRAP